jgi:GntR family transcriptional regulator/MocR family aminotransferase
MNNNFVLKCKILTKLVRGAGWKCVYEIKFSKPTGGLAVWAKFDQTVPLPDLARRARENGLWISDGLHYSPKLNATRLGFASVNAEEIERGMGILKRSIFHG